MRQLVGALDDERFIEWLEAKVCPIPITEWERRYREFIDLDYTKLEYDQIGDEHKQRGLYEGMYAIDFSQWNQPFYRVRKDLDESKLTNFVDELSFPPPHITPMGRANKNGQPVFYCSDIKKAAIAEARLKDEEFAVLGIWEMSGVEKRKGVAVHPYWNFKATATLSFLNEYMREGIAKYIGNFDQKYHEHLWLPFKVYNEAFVHEGDAKHKLTSWLCSRFLFETIENTNPIDVRGVEQTTLDGYSYPSIENNHVGTNFAFHPNFVRQHLRLKVAYGFKLSNSNETKSEISLLYTGILHRSSIVWVRPTEAHAQDFFKGFGNIDNFKTTNKIMETQGE